MNEHWNRERVTKYLRGKEVLLQVRQLLLEWLSGDRAAGYLVNADDAGRDKAGPYLELTGEGAARVGRLYCSEIYSPDGFDFLPILISPGLDQVSDLGAALDWAQRDSGHLILSSPQRRALYGITRQIDLGPHLEHVAQAIPGSTATERIINAPAIIVSVWLRAYERMWVRYELAWSDPDAEVMAVELATAAKALLGAGESGRT